MNKKFKKRGRPFGYKIPEEQRRKLSFIALAHKRTPPSRKGKLWTKESRQGVSGNKNHQWVDGRTEENQKIRNSVEYKLWRTAVFERDNYTCIWCGARS